MPQIDLTLYHRLPRQEAKQRVERLMEQLHQRYGSYINGVEKRWDGNTLIFALQRGGQSIPGEVAVQDRSVSITVALPWLLSFLKGRIQAILQEEGQRLLAR